MTAHDPVKSMPTIKRNTQSTATLAVSGLGAVAFLADGGIAVQIGLCLLVALLLQLPLRSLVLRQLRRAGLWGEDVDVPGRPDLATHFRKNWHYGINPRLADSAPEGIAQPRQKNAAVLAGAEILGDPDRLATLQRQYDDVILLADLPGLRVSGLQPAGLNGRIGLTLRSPNPGRTGRAVRRALDLLIAVPAVVLLSPVILLAGLAIRLADPGPVFYRQAREGRDGSTIQVLKLRTMYRDAEQRLKDLLARDHEAQAEWQTHFKLKSDPRILPGVGSILRSSSCDELPQLWNVIVGDMGIVGPRPFPFYHLDAMDKVFRRKRCSVTPGITGLWQVSERSNADIDLQQQLDGFYIDNRSVWFDLHLVLKTFSAVVSRNGAH
ncbi:sugar transferase [Paracoccaceae bacterium Fryx2]|nr:sugar transferase [Paracoccaceae bacterium Fryx2]